MDLDRSLQRELLVRLKTVYPNEWDARDLTAEKFSILPIWLNMGFVRQQKHQRHSAMASVFLVPKLLRPDSIFFKTTVA